MSKKCIRFFENISASVCLEHGMIYSGFNTCLPNVKKLKPCISLILLFLLTGFTRSPVFADASQTIVLNSVMVDLWPEYDRPSVLVIYEIELGEPASFPLELTFQVPAKADMQTVASRDDDGELIPLEWEASSTGQWMDIQFTTMDSYIRLEYYDPSILKQDDQRLFKFTWSSLYPASDLSIYVQQPYGASDLATIPEMTEVASTTPKSAYYMLEVGPVEAGDPYVLQIQYAKNTSNLAYPALDVFAAAPINRNTTGRAASILGVVLGLLVIATALLLLVGLYYLRFRKKNDLQIKGGGPDGVVINPDKQAVFCHECGSRSKPGDSYCRNCGTELRRFI